MVRYLFLKGYYDIEKTIGCGGFAKVKLATHVATGEKVAIKIMSKTLLGADLPRVTIELDALKNLSHKNICKLYEVIETETHFFIVMEYCSGGELFDHIVEKNRLSEAESRSFFRQIVAAIAYLHSVGYAHRDIKPENVLLDKHQNVKLIDFGLCAKPDKGMESPLFTSCGSPTYAAPELVAGKPYLGTEVDVWALGVLLYALLSGSLPFDDFNIDSLYKKILAGKYPEPSFMSQESRRLISSMLQVDPKKRITINDLLDHHWLTLNDILDPVEVDRENFRYFDEDCVNVMSEYYRMDPDVMWKKIQKWNYDYYTSTYFLLLIKKKRGAVLRLYHRACRQAIKKKDDDVKIKENVVENRSNCDGTPLSHQVRQKEHDVGNKTACIRKPLKRIRSPGLEDSSPIPQKRPVQCDFSTPMNTPDRKIGDTPGSSRKVLGSIERSLHKVMSAFSSKKNEDSSGVRPAILSNKDVCNVSTTQCRDPEFVMTELINALERKGISCKRKGFILRGKFEPTENRPFGECSFELEICHLPTISSCQTPARSSHKKKSPEDEAVLFVGIKRKRLKGDSWCYKKVCEEVLALTSTGLKKLESAV